VVETAALIMVVVIGLELGMEMELEKVQAMVTPSMLVKLKEILVRI